MVSMIALGIVTLLEHPEQHALFVSDPEKWTKPFVEELCRFHTASALATKRVAKEDVVLAGVKIQAGEGIIAATMSGNRDEEVFGGTADVFDMRRERGEEEALGYGWGEHRCVAEVSNSWKLIFPYLEIETFANVSTLFETFGMFSLLTRQLLTC